MRHMTDGEKLAVRMALREQGVRLEALEKLSNDVLERAAYRLRRETGEELLRIFGNGGAVLLPFEAETPQVERPSSR